ncbi:MAG: tetratricopeptide repeat protein [Candidatus Babeliales bacterium]
MRFSLLFLGLCLSYCAFLEAFFDFYKAVGTYRTQDYASALEQFEALLTENPDDGELNYNAGKAAYQQHEYQAAASYFTQAAKAQDVDPSLALQAWFDLGNTYVKQKKWQEAIESYEQVLKYDPEHKEARQMIEKIKKLLEQQQNQKQDQEQKQDQDTQEQQDQKKNNNQNKQDKQSNEKNNQNQEKNKSDASESQEQQENGADNEQNENQQDSSAQQNDSSKDSKKSKDASQSSEQQEQGEQDNESESDKNAQDGKSSQNDRKKQDFNNKKTKQGGQEVGQESKPDNADKNSEQRGGDDLENSIPEIQDHERKDGGLDHAASPNQKQSNSTKQDTPVSGKAQGVKADPFAVDDGIDKNSREGKILQFIEARDAQAAQQLLKMNVQAQRKPGEKNW